MSDVRSREFARAVAPAVDALPRLGRLVPWGLGLLALGYLASGITVVQSGEVALVLRFGALTGDAAHRVHEPGLLWALPRPMDKVVRVQVGELHQLPIRGLRLKSRVGVDPDTLAADTDLDPAQEGYCITGDQRILQVDLVCRYRVVDPVAYALHHADTHRLIRNAVTGAMVRTCGTLSMDMLLTEGRQQLAVDGQQLAQARLDALDVGVQIAGLELRELLPPDQVLREFWAVQTAIIEYQTLIEKARFIRAQELPQAESDGYELRANAQMHAASITRLAKGEADAFASLLTQYHLRPDVVRELLYREAIERTFNQAGRRRFVPPPSDGEYSGLRITIPTRR